MHTDWALATLLYQAPTYLGSPWSDLSQVIRLPGEVSTPLLLICMSVILSSGSLRVKM